MIESFISELSQWLQGNPGWILIAVGLLAFVESLALVGIIVPGVALLFAAAAAAGAANIPLFQVLLSAFVGAVFGDGLSFFLGKHAS